jgi:hypothetical protein
VLSAQPNRADSCRQRAVGVASLLDPATRQDSPVSSPEVGVAECVEKRIDGAVEIAQPVT